MSNEVTLGRQASGVRRRAEEDVPTSAEVGALRARKLPKVSSKEKASVVAAVASSLKKHSFPSMDIRLKNIVASQVGDLLRGGFLLEDIERAAVELGLSWDQRRGHNRLTHLAARVRAEYWAEQQANHADLMLDDRAAYPRTVYGKPHPNEHPFANDGSGNCQKCEAPFGAHVRRAEVT